MKRPILFIVISLLFVSGWGRVLVAAFCPNMKEMQGCSMLADKSRAASHEGHEGMEMDDMESSTANDQANALSEQLSSCCAKGQGLPTFPVVASRGAEPSKQDHGALTEPPQRTPYTQLSSFAPPVTYRQHAPPGAATPRHVLINVFLI